MEQKPNKNNTESAILGLEMQVSTLEDDLGHLKVDCEIYTAKLREMNEAVRFVKTKARIVSLSEFKKLILDIEFADQKVYALKIGISAIEDKIDNKLKAIEHYTMLYEQEQEYLSRKILPFYRNKDD